jgi:xanthine dehydrogenase YagS FAD-binding subunit
MSTAYARPATIDEALELLTRSGSVPMGGGTDLAGQRDRGLVAPALVVDLQDAVARTIEPLRAGFKLGAGVHLAELSRADELAPYAVLRTAAASAASPLLRSMGTLGGNLAQELRCWYLRTPELVCWLQGGDTCLARRGEHAAHGLADDSPCIAGHTSDLAPALAALGATVELQSAGGGRVVPVLDLYAAPTEEERRVTRLEPGEAITAVLLPPPPVASVYLRHSERAAFSLPMVSVAAALDAGGTIRVVAAGVAPVPRLIDPASPLEGLPGHPQSSWKRSVLRTLVERAVAALDAAR